MTVETIDRIGAIVFLTVLLGGTALLIVRTIWREFK